MDDGYRVYQGSKTRREERSMTRIIAAGIVFFVLVVASDLDETSELAVAFAYVILLSAALTAGPVAFARISDLVTKGVPAQ